jgi:hypothetical protein
MRLCIRLHDQIHSESDTMPFELPSDQSRILRRKTRRGERLFSGVHISDYRNMLQLLGYSAIYLLTARRGRDHNISHFAIFYNRKYQLPPDWKLIHLHTAGDIHSNIGLIVEEKLVILAEAALLGGSGERIYSSASEYRVRNWCFVLRVRFNPVKNLLLAIAFKSGMISSMSRGT